MDITELYQSLIKAYSIENLNKITAKLIELYKAKHYHSIREITNSIKDYISIDEEKDSRCFTRLVALYHPDKQQHYTKQINNLYQANNFIELRNFSHIFFFNNIDSFQVSTPSIDIDYQPDYVYDTNEYEGYSFIDDIEEPFIESDFERNVYNAIKLKEYGSIDIEFPAYYLEDFEEFELSDSDIELLDGVEYCKHVKVLDLSNNKISDLTLLWDLTNLKELFLSNNQIGYIDSLSNLFNITTLDLSYNEHIDDLKPIYDLEKLEYINIIGCPVPQYQIEALKEKGILVVQ